MGMWSCLSKRWCQSPPPHRSNRTRGSVCLRSAGEPAQTHQHYTEYIPSLSTLTSLSRVHFRHWVDKVRHWVHFRHCSADLSSSNYSIFFSQLYVFGHEKYRPRSRSGLIRETDIHVTQIYSVTSSLLIRNRKVITECLIPFPVNHSCSFRPQYRLSVHLI